MSNSLSTQTPPDDAVHVNNVIVVCVASFKVSLRLTFPLNDACRSRVLSQFGVSSKIDNIKILEKPKYIYISNSNSLHILSNTKCID